MTTLSIKRLWTLYKAVARAHGTVGSKRHLALSRLAFYSGARGVLKVRAHMLEQGDIDELHRTIQRQGRQIRVNQGLRPRKGRH
jgi:hypothetical protein